VGEQKMRRLLLALVGMAGLAAAALILLLLFSEKFLSTAITYTILGQIPGTTLQLNFTSSVITGSTVIVAGIGLAIIYRRISSDTLPNSYRALASDTNEEQAEPFPFDSEDFIMVASEIAEQSVSGHQSLPVQLQLF
jgi:hypothetical protein